LKKEKKNYAGDYSTHQEKRWERKYKRRTYKEKSKSEQKGGGEEKREREGREWKTKTVKIFDAFRNTGETADWTQKLMERQELNFGK